MCRKLAASPAFATDGSAAIEGSHAFFRVLPGHAALMTSTLSLGK